MVRLITEGIGITVETFYQDRQSNPFGSDYEFAYRITIENLLNEPVKLLSRHWIIKDSNGTEREVQGEGVVGQQPIIAPGEQFQYISGAALRTDMGKMLGSYIMENQYNKKKIRVAIPAFDLVAPFKNN